MTSAETEEKQPTLLEQMGGVSGMLYSSLPVVVFVIVNFATKNLMAAIISALAASVVIGVMLAVRKGTVQPAISAVFGVGIAAFIAYSSARPRGSSSSASGRASCTAARSCCRSSCAGRSPA